MVLGIGRIRLSISEILRYEPLHCEAIALMITIPSTTGYMLSQQFATQLRNYKTSCYKYCHPSDYCVHSNNGGKAINGLMQYN